MKNTYKVDNDKVIIYMPNKKGETYEAVVSLEDLPKLKDLDVNWCASYSKLANSHYVCGSINKNNKTTTLSLHRFLFNYPTGFVIDHINHDTLDNRRENLRKLTHAENHQNRLGAMKSSKTGVRGVFWDNTKRAFIAKVKLNGKRVFNKTFHSLEEAEKAVINARKLFMPYSMN